MSCALATGEERRHEDEGQNEIGRRHPVHGISEPLKAQRESS